MNVSPERCPSLVADRAVAYGLLVGGALVIAALFLARRVPDESFDEIAARVGDSTRSPRGPVQNRRVIGRNQALLSDTPARSATNPEVSG